MNSSIHASSAQPPVAPGRYCLHAKGVTLWELPMAIHEVLDRRVFAIDEVVFKEGEVGRRCAYLVENGRVEISKRQEDGEYTVLGYITAGGIFGEMALVDNKPRMAMARAVDATSVIIISESMLEAKLKKADPFIRGLLNVFVRNIRDMANRMAHAQGAPKPPPAN